MADYWRILTRLVSAQKIGFVFQNPENQLVMDTVIQELAFSLENSGEASANIQKRIAELVSFLGIQDILYASVHELSGGQKQLVNLAANFDSPTEPIGVR
ncbi:ATP-binding cassette domain-containing protein [Latilactobacillus sakei]